LENGVYFVANQKIGQFLRKPLMRNYLNEGNVVKNYEHGVKLGNGLIPVSFGMCFHSSSFFLKKKKLLFSIQPSLEKCVGIHYQQGKKLITPLKLCNVKLVLNV